MYKITNISNSVESPIQFIHLHIFLPRVTVHACLRNTVQQVDAVLRSLYTNTVRIALPL